MRNNELIELLDIAPTIMEAAGLEIYEGMQGKSLIRQLTGIEEKHRDDVYCEYYNSIVKHTNPEKLIFNT